MNHTLVTFHSLLIALRSSESPLRLKAVPRPYIIVRKLGSVIGVGLFDRSFDMVMDRVAIPKQ
jgi:hypothetical protein